MPTTVDILQKYNQIHILDVLSRGKKIPVLEDMNLEGLLKYAKQLGSSLVDFNSISCKMIEDLSIEDIQKIERQKDMYYKLGTSQLKEQKMAVIILSGGQGSRLGYNHAKGMYDVGIKRSVSIFELLVNSLVQRVKEIDVPIPLFIMTSRGNHEEIQQFFVQHDFFGYPKRYVEFFVQNEYPALDSEGKLFLTQDDELLMLPSGNGDWYEMLVKSKILDKPQYNNIEWFNVVSVDNPLQKMADPIFWGATISSECDVGAKVIRKSTPEEKMGVICRVDGKPTIIEYYEFPATLKYQKTESGEYKYQYGVTLNYIFKKTALDACRNLDLPFHYVSKSVRINSDTNIVLIKPEKLILDMISYFDKICAYEIVREKEFAPIKNRSGIDSVETARALLQMNGVVL